MEGVHIACQPVCEQSVAPCHAGVDPRSQDAYATLWQVSGRTPTHNAFVEAARARGVSRTRARKDYQRLRGQPSRPPDKEDSMLPAPPSVSPDARPVSAQAPGSGPGQALRTETQALREQVATLQRRDQAREREVQELRSLVQTLSPRPGNGELTEVVQHLGKALADLRLLTQHVHHQAAEHAGLATRVHALEARLAAWFAIERLARTDPDVRQALESLLQIASPSTRGTLHTAVAAALGWPRPTKYIRQ